MLGAVLSEADVGMSEGDVVEIGPEWSATHRRGSETELRAWRDVALACCDAADDLALRSFRGDLDVERKPDQTFVTQVDRAIEREIRERIHSAFPDHGIVGEEEGPEDAGASVRWFVDPIDATHNFMRGIPVFASLLAVERDGEVQVGVVSAPALRERWVAWRGGGAWNAAGRLHVSSVGSWRDANVVYSSFGQAKTAGFARLLGAASRAQALGDFWGYALVSQGSADAMVESEANTWDLAAPFVLIEEAGGRITGLTGERTIGGGGCVASNGVLHPALLGELAELRLGS